MAILLADLARLVDGNLIGDGSVEINGAATLATARPGEISFLDDLEKTAPDRQISGQCPGGSGRFSTQWNPCYSNPGCSDKLFQHRRTFPTAPTETKDWH